MSGCRSAAGARPAGARGWPLALLVGVTSCSADGCGGGAPATTAPSSSSSAAAAATNDPALASRLEAALRAKGADYVARTRHKTPDGRPLYKNRLILTSSPYLLQHAHNPVNWFPWGEEAFARARSLGRPIFLSIGYATCHWCHVMEEESFEDEAVAAYLNDHYVAIKVDREELPDVDAAHMAFVQAFTGSGGWPMNVWLTPQREPFFGGTYFPPKANERGKRAGFLDVLRAQADRLAADPVGVAQAARSATEQLRTMAAPAPAGDFPPASLLEGLPREAEARFDPKYGGARGAPKFPSSFPIQALLRVARRSGAQEPRQMAMTTLEGMRRGGLHDPIGGGFHRYATDGRWQIPHFEKMLYDNALLAVAYLEGAQASTAPAQATRLRDTARETLDYLLRELQLDDGTFASGTDADSLSPTGTREEGAFFTWTAAELLTTLGDDDASLGAAAFGVTPRGDVDGRSVLSERRSIEEVARELSLDPAAAATRLSALRPRMLEARSRRPAPLRDDKALASWNGLAISALARAAIVTGEPRYRDAALRAASVFVAPGRAGRAVPHLVMGGRESGLAFADDLALLAQAWLDLFELTSDPGWLDDAIREMETLEASFADPEAGGYFLGSAKHDALFVRPKPDRDGPVPCASSVAAMVWLRLDAALGESRFRQRAEATVRAFSPILTRRPLALDHMLLALDRATDAPLEVVVVVGEGRGALAAEARPLLDVLGGVFAPHATVLVATEADLAGALGDRLPWAQTKVRRGGRATAYVCERGSCKLPTTDPVTLRTQLAEARPYR